MSGLHTNPGVYDQPRLAPPPAAAERELLASLGGALIGGRWAILGAELVAAALRFPRVQESPLAEIALGAMIVYNIVAVWVLYRLPPTRIPVALLLAADVITVGALAGLTGGIDSPFAGLFYLVTLAGAIYYDLTGGLVVATTASAIILISSAVTNSLWEDLVQGHARTQMIPYLILTGGFAGYLVGRLKRLHERRIEIEERLRRIQHEEQLRQREAEIAQRIQQAAFTEPPPHPNFEIAVRFQPAREVGGDFYSFFTYRRRVGVLVGDVSGKGVPAALVSTSLGYLARWLRPLEDPDRFLTAVNRALWERLPEDAFASMAFVVLDPEAERLVIYNAGHPPPLIIGSGAMRRAQTQNLLLGIAADARFEPETFSFRNGDVLVLYSDGFFEVRNPAGELLSLEGLEALVERHAALPPEDLATRLVADVQVFGTVTDDLTLVVVRARQ
ncbi:MAG: PP2C family protein-serine/threonine phosphatase [Armatimonadetes bacterium]|nr:PP2C family protein-serine/threonine phosphatase [Armatimonadota bacterium]